MATIIKRNSTTTTNTTASSPLRSVGYSLRGTRMVSDVVRQTINVTIDEYGRVSNSNFSLGNRGDNLVTYLDFNIASVIQVEKLADYDVILFIYNPRLGKSNLNPIKVEPQAEYTADLVRFILESNWFSSAGTYELIFGLIEKTSDDGNVDKNLEVFLSDVMKANLMDTGIHGDFVEQLIPDALPVDADSNFDEFIQKPHLTAQLEDNALKIIGTSNVNQWDAYTTYIQLEGFSPLLNYFYLIYNMPSVDNTAYGSVRFIEENGEDWTTYKTWIPKSWTATETKVRAWVVGTDLEITQSMIDDGSWRQAKIYVTNSFDFQTKTNFLDKESWEITLLESEDLKLLDKEEKDILVIPENIGGTYRLNYTGSEVDDLLSYVNQLKNGGGGGDGKAIVDVDILPEEGYVGTIVPNTGYVENIYINDKLTADEYFKICNSLDYNAELNDWHLVCLTADASLMLFVQNSVTDDNNQTVMIGKLVNGEITWYAQISKASDEIFINFNETNVAINNTVVSELSDQSSGMTITSGVQNELLSSLFSTTPFVKQEIKKELLYRTPDTKLHQWGKTIETVIQEGVAVSNIDYVDKIYFNTNLKLEDIIAQLSKLTYIYADDSGIGQYPVFAGTNTNKQIVVIDYSSIGFGYVIGDMSSNELSAESVYFISSASLSSTAGAGFVGWNPLYENNYVDIQDTPNTDYVNDINQNELIKNILSTVEIKMDTIEKEDFVEVLTNNSYDVLNTTPGGKVGKIIESNENVFIEKIYFDKEMPVDAVLSALVPIENWIDGTGYLVFTNSDGSFFLSIMNYDRIIPGYGVLIMARINSEEVPLFASSPQLLGFSGWNPDIENNYIEVNSYGVGAMEDSPAGAENDKLTSIFSANEDFKTVGISNKLVEFKEKGVPIYPKTNIQNVEGLNTILNSKQNALTSEYGINIALGTISSAAHISIGHPCIFVKETYEQIKKWLIKGLDVYVGTPGSYFGEEHNYSEVRGQVVEVAGTTDWDYLDYIDHFTVEFIVNGKSYRYRWSSGGVEEFIKTIDSSIENLETLPEKKWTGFPIQAEAIRGIEDNNDKLYFNTNLSLEEIYNILKNFGSSSGTTVFLDEKLNSETNEYEIQQNMVIYYDSWKNKVTVEMNNRNFDKLTTTSFSITYTDNNYTLEGTIPDYINISNSGSGNNGKSSGSRLTYKISSFISSKPFNYIAVDNPNMIFRTPDNRLWQYKYDIELTDGEPLSSGTKTVHLNFKQRTVNKLISILEQLAYDSPSTNNVPTASLGNAQYSSVEFAKEENKYTLYNWRTPILYIERNTNGQWVLSEEKVGTITLTNSLYSQTTSQMNNSQLLRNFISRSEFKETYIETEGFVELPKTPITDLEELPKAGWKGTTVPNEGFVEHIYFNTDLSVEETVNILKQLEYFVTGDTADIYPLLFNSDGSIGIMAMRFLAVEGTEFDPAIPESYTIVDYITSNFYFVSNNIYNNYGKVGWQDITNPIELNSEVIADADGLTVGNQNNLLSSLFSTTSFEKVELDTIDPNYLYRTPDNSIHQLVTKDVVNYIGTAVNNSGTVSTVYFNDKLSLFETTSLLMKLDYVATPFLDNPIAPLLFSSSGSPVIFAVQTDDGYEINISTDIINGEFDRVFMDYEFGGDMPGWYMNSYNINSSVISDYQGISVGTQNELLSSLFSTIPFESVVEKVKEFEEINKPNVVYISAMSEEGTFTNEEIELLKGDNTIIVAETSVPGSTTIGMIFRKGVLYDVPGTRLLTYENVSGDIYGTASLSSILVDLSSNTWRQVSRGTVATLSDIKKIELYDEIQNAGSITLRFTDFDGMTHHLGDIMVVKQIGSSGSSNALVTHDAVKDYIDNQVGSISTALALILGEE